MPITVEGIIENGQVKLPPDVHLPDSARVYIVIPDRDPSKTVLIASPRLANPEQAADFRKIVIEEEPDARL